MTAFLLPCPEHGGPALPSPSPHAWLLDCPGLTAIVIGGEVAGHLGPGELGPLAEDLHARQMAAWLESAERRPAA
jgi:hypothetical protein